MRRAEIGFAKATTLIILIVMLIVIFPFLNTAFAYTKGFADGGVCGGTAALSAARWTGPACITVVQSPVSMSCTRDNIFISQDTITTITKGKVREEAVYGRETIGEAASRVVVDELASCWETFGRGGYPLFTQARDNWLANFDSAQNTVCHICSEISFAQGLDLSDSSVQRALNAQRTRSETYREFMNSERTLCKPEIASGSQTCWDATEDYFTNKENNARISRTIFESTKTFSQIDKLEEEKTYAVVLMREGMQRCDTASNAAGTEDPKLTMFAYVIAHDELSTACDTLIT